MAGLGANPYDDTVLVSLYGALCRVAERSHGSRLWRHARWARPTWPRLFANRPDDGDDGCGVRAQTGAAAPVAITQSGDIWDLGSVPRKPPTQGITTSFEPENPMAPHTTTKTARSGQDDQFVVSDDEGKASVHQTLWWCPPAPTLPHPRCAPAPPPPCARRGRGHHGRNGSWHDVQCHHPHAQGQHGPATLHHRQ